MQIQYYELKTYYGYLLTSPNAQTFAKTLNLYLEQVGGKDVFKFIVNI